MISEVTDGVILDYVPDALGSVHTVVDQSAAVVKSMRYKPYGDVLSRSGTVADRHYQWVGSYGYRATFAPSSSHYVRARHYSATSGSWTTVDPLWPDESAYGYVRGESTRSIDLSGMQQVVPPGVTEGIIRKCQGRIEPNDCSKLGTSPKAICIASMCAADAASNVIGWLPNTSGDLPKDILNDLIEWGKGQGKDFVLGGGQDPRDWSPTDCCKEASTGKPVGSIPNATAQIIKKLCDYAPGVINCLTMGKKIGGCCKCCDLNSKPSTKQNLLCHVACENKFNNPGGCSK